MGPAPVPYPYHRMLAMEMTLQLLAAIHAAADAVHAARDAAEKAMAAADAMPLPRAADAPEDGAIARAHNAYYEIEALAEAARNASRAISIAADMAEEEAPTPGAGE